MEEIINILKEEIKPPELSKRNLNRLLSKTSKYKTINDESKVNAAIQGLCLYHCTNQINITTILRDGFIKTKDNLSGATVMTNNGSDMLQGVDKHISMSFGQPWPEYGNYCFVFGLKHMSEDSLVFFIDPWKLDSHHLEDYVLTRNDFIILLKELLSKNIYFINKDILFKPFWKSNLHELAKYNFRKFELKQSKDLNLKDADEFFIWTRLENFMLGIVRLCWRWWMLVIVCVGIWLMVRTN